MPSSTINRIEPAVSAVSLGMMPTLNQSQGSAVLRRSMPRRRTMPRHYAGQAAETPRLAITNRSGHTLEDEHLLKVAHEFSDLELQILQIAHDTLQSQISIDNAISEDDKEWLVRVEQALKDLRDAKSDGLGFSSKYLRDTELVPFWQAVCRGLGPVNHMGAAINEHPLLDIKMDQVRHLENQALELPEALKEAARHGKIDTATKNAIKNKYLCLDATLDYLHEHGQERQLPTWHVVAGKLKEAPSSGRVADSATRFSVVLWTIFVATVVVSGPLAAYAWNLSDHARGIWAEEDFFWLLQASLMQAFGIVITAITVYRKGTVPSAAWAVPAIVAIGFSIAAPVLYCFALRWWGSFAAQAAASIQAFMVLQLALYGY